ncbi:MAG: hypothetical protein KC502_14915 [Myxococcales bacterium]|nr:hypothetical protein [Myxococcales bacterium]
MSADVTLTPHAALLAMLFAHNGGTVGFGALMRGLTVYEGWRTIADPSGGVLTRPSVDGPWLDLFADDAALLAHLSKVPQDIDLTSVGVNGSLFAHFDEGLAGIHIHPGQDHELILDRANGSMARAWATTALIEAMLVQRKSLDLDMLRQWQGWQLLMRSSPAEDKPQLVLTADARGRPVAAVFTADDCREAFLERLPPAMRAGMTVRRMMGAQIFAQLAHMPVHGAAFNPAGPVPSRGYDRAWLARIARHRPTVN